MKSLNNSFRWLSLQVRNKGIKNKRPLHLQSPRHPSDERDWHSFFSNTPKTSQLLCNNNENDNKSNFIDFKINNYDFLMFMYQNKMQIKLCCHKFYNTPKRDKYGIGDCGWVIEQVGDFDVGTYIRQVPVGTTNLLITQWAHLVVLIT